MPCIQDPGSWILDTGSSTLDLAPRFQGPGSRVADAGSWIQDRGTRVLDTGSRTQDPDFKQCKELCEVQGKHY